MKIINIHLLLLLFIIPSYAQKRVVNYDEDKAGTYTLPEILKTGNNKQVKSVRKWEKVRRPEILSLFENEVYGQVPKDFDHIEFSIINSDPNAMGGKAHLKEVQVEVFRNNNSVKIDVVLFVPSEAPVPSPAFLLINNRSKLNMDPRRDTISGFWPAEEVIEAGYAVAAFQVNDAAPDNKENYADGVLKLYPEQLQKDNGMMAIGAWGWAASRIMDYFEKDDDIDASRVTLVGHSRGGKASLWAAAQDQRFAICVSNNSGNTGAALSRRNYGETVEIINTSFPHWFTRNYKKYNGNEQNLPVDQHMLIGLIAPRPVYITSASEDRWADPKGTFLAMKAAESVYSLYSLPSMLPMNPPAVNTPTITPPMGYHIREGKHNLTVYDWHRFIEFADLHFRNNLE